MSLERVIPVQSLAPTKITEFLEQLNREQLGSRQQLMAVLEVCGFNAWLIRPSHGAVKRRD